MSWTLMIETKPKARKEYNCQASDFITDADQDEFDHYAKTIIQQAEKEKWKIKKGDRYVKIKGVFDGEFATFRARIDLDQLCQDYDLYEL